MIIDSMKSDIPKRKEPQLEIDEEFLDFSEIDHGMLQDDNE